MKKILIAYYSRKGQNYVNGNVVDLKEGNTSIVAKEIQALTGGDLFQIETIKPYAIDYTECTKEAKEELNQQAFPELKETINTEDYDVIFLGYPNWWGTYPRAVATFIKENNFFHKTIIPFCTHEGSGMGHSVSDLKKVCDHCDVLNGMNIRGSQARHSQEMVKQYIESIKEEL